MEESWREEGLREERERGKEGKRERGKDMVARVDKVAEEGRSGKVLR